MPANIGLLAPSAVSGINIGEYTSDQKHPLGTLGLTRDGRIFRYAQAGASALVVGNILESAAPIPNHLARTPPAVAIGDKSFSFTPGATGGAANLYAEGYLQVDTTPGNGYTYGVSGHPAITASTAFTLTLDEAIREVALTTSSRVGLHHNPYKNVIIGATTVGAPTIGGAVAPITAAYYGWIQTRGPFCALIDGTPGVGIGLQVSNAVAGALEVAAVAAEIDTRRVARMMQVGVDTKNNMVFLELD